MAEPGSGEDDELNFSDHDADSNSDGELPDSPKPKSSLIAHKEMKLVPISDAEDSDDESDNGEDTQGRPNDLEFENISPANSPISAPQHEDISDDESTVINASLQENEPNERDFMSPSSPPEQSEQYETISPPASPQNNIEDYDETKSKFENISDDEDDGEKFVNELRGSEEPVQDENSNDSAEPPVETMENQMDDDLATEVEIGEEETENVGEDSKTSVELDVSAQDESAQNESGEKGLNESNESNDNLTVAEPEDDVEAPMPSPFSDIGDMDDDMMEGDGQIISDILKDTDDTEKQFEFELGAPPHKPEPSIETSIDLEGDDEDSFENKEKASPEKVKTGESDANDGESAKTNSEEKEEYPEEDAGDLIADIFGESDDEEEFEGFADEDIQEEEEKKSVESDDEPEIEPPKQPDTEEGKDEDSDDERPMPARDFVNDFDLMIEKKKELARLKRKKKDSEACGDNDEIIVAMISKMKEAADSDRLLNQAGKAATKKLKMLETVVKHLRKSDIQMALIDCGVLGAMKEWLTPLPDHALPHKHIRERFLRILQEFPTLDKSALKSSGIGRAVMLLFKHPKETRENRFSAGKLISSWARPIFNVSTNFLDVSKEERMERDKKTLEYKKRSKEELEAFEPKRTKLDRDEADADKPRKPGDKGWCGRARVPQASSRDYVNRPQSKLDAYEQSRQLNTKKPLNRYEKHALKMKAKRPAKAKAMEISLSGSKMGL